MAVDIAALQIKSGAALLQSCIHIPHRSYKRLLAQVWRKSTVPFKDCKIKTCSHGKTLHRFEMPSQIV